MFTSPIWFRLPSCPVMVHSKYQECSSQCKAGMRERDYARFEHSHITAYADSDIYKSRRASISETIWCTYSSIRIEMLAPEGDRRFPFITPAAALLIEKEKNARPLPWGWSGSEAKNRKEKQNKKNPAAFPRAKSLGDPTVLTAWLTYPTQKL